MVFLCRQNKGVHTVEEMQLLRDHADYLEKKVMRYEHENQALRSDLDMLVYLHTTYTRVCSSAVHVLRVNTLKCVHLMCYVMYIQLGTLTYLLAYFSPFQLTSYTGKGNTR